METIIAATKNPNKIREMNAIVMQLGFSIISRDDAGVPDVEIVEDGKTFEENSLKKAMEIMKLSGRISLADDSGLSVYALDGAPGVYSARFAGEDKDDAANNRKLLKLMDGLEGDDRRAVFVSVITIAYTDGSSVHARGECEGMIAVEPHGNNGFGYDPIFIPNGFDKTFAQLSAGEKNSISHRARALSELADILRIR